MPKPDDYQANPPPLGPALVWFDGVAWHLVEIPFTDISDPVRVTVAGEARESFPFRWVDPDIVHFECAATLSGESVEWRSREYGSALDIVTLAELYGGPRG